MLPSCARLVRLAFLVSVLAAAAQPALAMETDQFTTPRAPLFDIGPLLSRKVADIIESDRTGRDPERVLSDWVGNNPFASRLTHWLKQIPDADDRVRFLPRLFDSIYSRTYSPVPMSFLFDSPTVKVHGIYLGTDKIDHFFQVGHEYYGLVQRQRAQGADDASAVAAAVAHGVKQEHAYFGTLASGIYSNADLAADFAGMTFFLNLREPVRIGDQVWQPLFERTPQGWRIRPGVDRDQLLRPFISNHLDESLNPNRYRFDRGGIRARLRDRCDRWMQFYADRLVLVARSGEGFATTWFGENYGHWLPPVEEVSIATECVLPDRSPAISASPRGEAPLDRSRIHKVTGGSRGRATEPAPPEPANP
jgi:hypothetical protein